MALGEVLISSLIRKMFSIIYLRVEKRIERIQGIYNFLLFSIYDLSRYEQMCENGVFEEQQEINHKAMCSQSNLASFPSAQSRLRTLHFLPA